MALINHRAREIHFKIVYYGPSLGGKTTNLRMLHERLPADRRGKMLSIATDHERTLFFDFLPFALGQIQGYTTRIHLYTTPGQAYYRLSRRAVLQGLDGLVFVADSHPARESANLESLEDLHEHLGAIGMTPEQLAKLAWVFQYNKRDLPAAMPIDRMRRALNRGGALEFEAAASEGRGVSETLRAICKGVIAQVNVTGIPALAPPVTATPSAIAPTIVDPAAPSTPSVRSVVRPAPMPARAVVRPAASAPFAPREVAPVVRPAAPATRPAASAPFAPREVTPVVQPAATVRPAMPAETVTRPRVPASDPIVARPAAEAAAPVQPVAQPLPSAAPPARLTRPRRRGSRTRAARRSRG